MVSFCDREGDFWDLLAHAVDGRNALLVRASRSAKQRVTTPDGGKECLWEHVAAMPPVAVTELTIPAAGGPRSRKERVARLEIRAAEVGIVPPCWDRGADPLPMFGLGDRDRGRRRRLAALAAADHRAPGGGGGRRHARRDRPRLVPDKVSD